ncbi:N-acyl homoserine lactone hydrolase [Ruminococcus sp. YE282]|nr:N-acyl homoserine lactone hydrolase [Ruminococcus bromii]
MKICIIKNCVLSMKKGFSLFPSSNMEDEYPVYSFLFMFEKVSFLVDTGMAKETYASLGTIGKFFKVTDQKKVTDSLADIGCNKIDFIINTHLHFDHSGGNKLFRNIPIYIQKKEMDDFIANKKNPMYINQLIDGIDYKMVEGDKVIYKDDEVSVNLIFTPGHSKGHQSVLIEHGDKNFLVLGDVGYFDEEGSIIPFGNKKDSLYEVSLSSAVKINKIIHDNASNISVFVSHDESKVSFADACANNNIIIFKGE